MISGFEIPDWNEAIELQLEQRRDVLTTQADLESCQQAKRDEQAAATEAQKKLAEAAYGARITLSIEAYNMLQAARVPHDTTIKKVHKGLRPSLKRPYDFVSTFDKSQRIPAYFILSYPTFVERDPGWGREAETVPGPDISHWLGQNGIIYSSQSEKPREFLRLTFGMYDEQMLQLTEQQHRAALREHQHNLAALLVSRGVIGT